MAGLLAALAFLTIGVASSAAATLGVATTGADTGNCVADPCLTIQYAVDQASANDTINVAAGTYVEDVTIDKQLTLRGAQAGVDARTRSGAETIVQAANPGAARNVTFAPRANGITIDGFTITQSAAQTAGGIGIEVPLNAATQNLNVANNIITDNQYGMAGFTPGAAADITGMQVTKNYFLENNVDSVGPTTTAMFLMPRVADDVYIANNSFKNTFAPGGEGAAINISGTVANPMDDLVIANNSSENDQTFLVHYNGHNTSIEQNTVTDATGTSIFIGGNTDGVNIAGNTISDGATAGIRLTDVFGTTAPKNVSIVGNTISRMGTYGVVAAGAGDMEDLGFSGNDLIDNPTGIRFDASPELGGLTIIGNEFTGNDIGIDSRQAGPITVGNGNIFTNNDVKASGYVLGITPRTLYVATTGDDADNGCVFANDPCLTVQHAVDQAAPGDTISVGEGTFGATSGAATVAVNKPELTIAGTNTAASVIEAPDGPIQAAAIQLGEAADGLTIRDLSIASPDDDFDSDLRGIRTAPGPVTVEGLTLAGVQVSGLRYGFETPSVATAQQATITDMMVRNSYLHGNEYAMWFGGDTNGLDVVESVISGNDFGIQSYPPEPNPSFEPGVFDDVNVSETTFTANAKKAIYLEAASNLKIEGVNVLETGSVEPLNPPAYRPPFDGIDLNVKFGDFENISIIDTNSNGNVVNPIRTLAVQGGVSIKSRNDGSYAAHPASISNVDIDGLTASENENGLILGGDVDDIDVTESNFGGNNFAGVAIVRETAGKPSSVTNLSIDRSFLVENENGIATNTVDDPSDLTGLSVTRNFFDENDTGILIGTSGFTGSGIGVRGNVFSANQVGIDNDSATSLNAENNWWGCNAGPGTAGCDGTSGLVDATPYMVFSATSAATSVRPGGTTQVTAGFNRNSAGQAIDGSVFAGPAVFFSATNGSVNPTSRPLAAGAASTTFTAGSGLGPAVVTANLGDQVATATVQVTGIAPTISAPGLSGSGQVGDPLTCVAGQAGGIPAPTVTTEFLADGAVIPGQSGLSYTPVEGDVGKSITCRSTATNAVGNVDASSQAIRITAVPEPPKPPVVPPIKKNPPVPNSGKVVVTTITCPDGTCQVQAPKTIKVKIGGKTYIAKVKVQKKVGEGESAKVTIVLPKKARKAIKGKTGKTKLKITVTSSDGKKKVVNQTIKLKGGKR